jgi:transposase
MTTVTSPQLTDLTKEELVAMVAAARAELAETEAKLQYVLAKMYAPSSEKRPYKEEDGKQEDLFGIPVQQDPEPPPQTITVPAHERERSKPKGHGRQPVSRELPTEERIIHASEADKVGPNGEALVLLGYETSEKIDVTPETLFRLITKRERWGLADTRETLITAPVEACLVPKSKATDAFALDVILKKFHMGLPLARQLMDLNHRGAQLSDSFMSDLIKQTAERFRPIWEALRSQVLQNRVVYADETPIRQLIPISQGTPEHPDRRVRTSYFWAWLGGGQFYLHYGLTRSQDEVRKVLGIPEDGEWDPDGLIAFLVTDGYAGYNPVLTCTLKPDVARILRVFCWAHVRRRFLTCAERGDANARQLVALIAELFRIEKAIRKENDKDDRSGAAADAFRLERRQRDSAPIVAQIRMLIDRFVPCYTAGRDMAEHLAYTLRLWDGLTLFLSHGDLPTDNNSSERALRPIVVGRKNWLFVGSEDSGEWAAIFFSLIESCRMLKIDPRRYLAHVTPLIVGEHPPEASTLTPLALRAELIKR